MPVSGWLIFSCMRANTANAATQMTSKASVIRLAVWQASSRMPIVLEVGVPWPSSGTLKSGVSALWTLRSAGCS